MNIFKTSQSIGEIVSIMPIAGDIFKEYKIDYCCGGHRPLSEAITEQHLNGADILERLDVAYADRHRQINEVDYSEMPPVDLIDYIVDTHHSYLNKVLPQISGLTATILRVHGAAHNDLFKVHKLFNNLKTELEQHLIKEEEVLFPMIKEYQSKVSERLLEDIKAVAKETEDEHEMAGGVLKELRILTADYKIPEDACPTYQKTFETLEELETDLFKHIHLENNILFRRLGISGN